jgi:hypothetical protein
MVGCAVSGAAGGIHDDAHAGQADHGGLDRQSWWEAAENAEPYCWWRATLTRAI